MVSTGATAAGLVDTRDSPHATLYMVELDDVRWTGGFWAERFEVARDSMIPYMWDLFQDDNESHAWANYCIAAGLGPDSNGEYIHDGPPFNDGDLLKWFEGLASIYAVTKDPEQDALMDRIIEVVGKAQREDGYLHTQNIIPQRIRGENSSQFNEREHFETYNMGHLITAACIHHRATGKDNMLKLAIKAADYIEKLCEEAPGDLARNAICPSHYMGVMELYRVTGDERYRQLGMDLIDIRKLVPEDMGRDHNQDRIPFREQREAVGHAVRANYLYAGAADVYAEHGDAGLWEALTAIARDVEEHKLYITGMTGAIYDGASPFGTFEHFEMDTVHQAYGHDYQLPNITAYNETCATIGYNLWNWRMLGITADSRYADLFEQALYNGILPGISLEGTTYFYTNPLRKVKDYTIDLRWSKTREPNIQYSFCCPPNVVRTVAQVQNHVYTLSEDTLWVHLYGSNKLDTEWKEGDRISLTQESDWPWEGRVKLTIGNAPEHPVKLKLRIPEWAEAGANTVTVNGTAVDRPVVPGTYFELEQVFKPGDIVLLDIPFRATLYEGHPFAEAIRNQVAVRYGPLVYCVESNDLPDGIRIDEVALSADSVRKGVKRQPMRIANTTVQSLVLPALHVPGDDWNTRTLYRKVNASEPNPFELTMVPYYAWGNRGDTEMLVWLRMR
jgi:hypothetical protein